MKLIPANAAPGAVPQSRGRVMIIPGKRGIIAAKWPEPRGQAKQGYDYFRQKEFQYAARMAANPHWLDQQTAEEMVKGTLRVPRDFLQQCIYGTAYQLEFEDGFKWPIGRRVTSNANYILDLVTNVPGSLLFRGAILWDSVGPGEAGQVLTMVGTEPQWADAGGGGGPAAGPWELLQHVQITSPLANIDFTNLAADAIMILIVGVTSSASGIRRIRFSTDNGASFYAASGDYQLFTASGGTASLTQALNNSTATNLARTYSLTLEAAAVAGSPKVAVGPSGDTVIFTASSAPIDAVRVDNSAGNLTAGDVYLLGKAV